MSLELEPRLARELEAHLERAYPEEGCGVLLGRDQPRGRRVERVIGFENMQDGPRGRRYRIDPEQLLGAEREARSQGLEVLGFFHSHPDHPARPSAFDLENAWPYYSYLIVSVERGRARAARSWRLAEDRSRFEPEALAVPGESGAGVGLGAGGEEG